MDIFLTGGTGFVGSAIVPVALRHGHSVRALARSEAAAAGLREAGAIPVLGSLHDTELLTREATEADGVIHTASPGDQTSAALDKKVIDAVLGALRGTNKPYLHTSGVWIYGNTDGEIDEDAPLTPPPVTAWRLPLDARVRASAGDGVRGIVIGPGIVYGHGKGLPNLLVNAPRTAEEYPALTFPGTGDQHWTTIHVDDLARLYVAALTRGKAGSYYIGVSGANPLVRDLAQAASHGIGLEGRVAPEDEAATRERLGPLADAFFLDQQATGARARTELDWEPKGPTLVDELSIGSYSDPDA